MMPHTHGGTDAPECTTCQDVWETALIERIQRVVGYVPVGTKDLLHILTHPDVVSYTQNYITGKKA